MSVLTCQTLRAHPDTEVRTARPDDHNAILALLMDANREYRGLLPARVFHAYMQNLRSLVADEDMRVLMVAELNGHVLGAVAFYPDASRQSWDLPKGWAGIHALAVDPTARGRGIGRQLAEACILKAWRIGAPVACLHTAPFHHTARRLCHSMGFVRSPEHDRDVGNFPELDLPHVDARGERFIIEAFRLDLRA